MCARSDHHQVGTSRSKVALCNASKEQNTDDGRTACTPPQLLVRESAIRLLTLLWRRLYHEVRLRGGMAAVVDKKLWSEVARAMDMESSHGSALRTQYTKILLPYEEWKVSIGEYRVQTDGQEEEEDEEEAAARREREKRLEEERERRRKRKEEKLSERMANEGEDGKPARLTRGRAKEEGGMEEEESSVTFSMAAGVIRVGSKVSVFWDGDGVSYKGVVRRT